MCIYRERKRERKGDGVFAASLAGLLVVLELLGDFSDLIRVFSHAKKKEIVFGSFVNRCAFFLSGFCSFNNFSCKPHVNMNSTEISVMPMCAVWRGNLGPT